MRAKRWRPQVIAFAWEGKHRICWKRQSLIEGCRNPGVDVPGFDEATIQ
jgi:hypothetical protein